VIFVHGFGESAANWSDGGNMLANVDSINGVMSLRFDYKSTNTKWVDNPLNGPALARYIKAVSAASAQGHGPGKVIIVAFSMGGLLTRYAATTDVPGTGPVAAYISMVITIGTPNEGSLAGNIRPLICAGPTVVTVLAEQHVPGICSDWTAADAMSLFAPQIMKLPQLPPSIPVLHAIAGDETFIWEIWAGHPQSRVMLPFFGDGVVTPGSALHKRPGWQNDTFDTFTNPWIPGDLSAWHLALKGYKPVIAKTRYYIQLYVQANQPQAPAQAAPAPGNDAYWLANGGQWSVHGVQLQISQGPSGLVGTENWNADGAVITGHAQLTFASQPDGSLVGTYTADTTYTGDASQLSVPFQPDPGAPLKGMVVVLRPDGPMHAQVVLGNDSPAMFSGGNLNFCQAGLPDASQYCGA
jgi:pimeloyl-ACP methyl ester carboxylesterase